MALEQNIVQLHDDPRVGSRGDGFKSRARERYRHIQIGQLPAFIPSLSGLPIL